MEKPAFTKMACLPSNYLNGLTSGSSGAERSELARTPLGRTFTWLARTHGRLRPADGQNMPRSFRPESRGSEALSREAVYPELAAITGCARAAASHMTPLRRRAMAG